MDVNLNNHWSEKNLGKHGENPDLETPFSFHIFPNLLETSSATKLRNDIKSVIDLDPKDNDLYKFKQSKDIKSETSVKKLTPVIKQFIEVMQGKIREHLERSTGIKLSIKHFDITVSRYDPGNYLLCHNDDIKNENKNHQRALAFIYYMNKRQWTSADGGALVIYESNEFGEPIEITNRIWPQNNSLVVFKTSATSWHSVEEVFCQDDCRLSINGWFHTEEPIDLTGLEKSRETNLFTIHRPNALEKRLEHFFEEYINCEYLTEKTCYLIRKKFKRQSEINLANFLVKEKYLEISKALKRATEDESNLIHLKPFNKRNYKRINVDNLPQVCKDLYDAFKSELFFIFLWRVTGLELQPPGWKREDTKMNDTSEEESDTDSSECIDDPNFVDQISGEDRNELNHDDHSDGSNQSSEQTGDQTAIETNLDDGSQAACSKVKRREEPKVVSDTQEKIANDNNRTKKQRVSDPMMRAEYRHLAHGSYTLIHDHDIELSESSGLDVILHFNHDFNVNFEHGGYISYIDAGDENVHDTDQELLTMEPKSNCLSIVYRGDSETCRFLKYINKFHESDYQDLSCVYYEKRDDLPYKGEGIELISS